MMSRSKNPAMKPIVVSSFHHLPAMKESSLAKRFIEAARSNDTISSDPRVQRASWSRWSKLASTAEVGRLFSRCRDAMPFNRNKTGPQLLQARLLVKEHYALGGLPLQWLPKQAQPAMGAGVGEKKEVGEEEGATQAGAANQSRKRRVSPLRKSSLRFCEWITS